jgi:hypothetical protein
MGRNLAIALISIGIILNNVSYLKDLFTGEFDGMIYVGWKAWLGIVIGISATVIGIVGLLRHQTRVP